MILISLIVHQILMNCAWSEALVSGSQQALGTGMDISKIEIGTSTLPKGYSIFKSDPLRCVINNTFLGKSLHFEEYSKNTQDMIENFGISAGLSAGFRSLVSLGASLRGTYKRTVKTSSSYSGFKRTYYMHTNKQNLDVNCLSKLELDEKFEDDFMLLEGTISRPERSDSWTSYQNFILAYGTHYVSEITYGASVTQYMSAESSRRYNENDFSIQACLDVTVPVKVGLVRVGPCGGFSRKKSFSRNDYHMKDNFIALGGKYKTRNKVITTHNLKYIRRLLDEGHRYRAPVSYKFTSFTDLLMKRFGRTGYVNQVANLKAYVEGFINFGCSYKREHNIELQKFELQRHSRFPQYQCTLAPEGCRENSDCKFRGKCKCRGDTCVRHDQLFPTKRTVAKINDSKMPGKIDKHCRWSLLQCRCKRPRYDSRKVVWPSFKQKKTQNALMKIMAHWSALF